MERRLESRCVNVLRTSYSGGALGESLMYERPAELPELTVHYQYLPDHSAMQRFLIKGRETNDSI